MKKHFSLFMAGLLIFATLTTGCSQKEVNPPQNQQSAPISYPTRAIDLVVPGAAGSSTDLQARIISKYLAEELGKPVNVVNREGGGSVTGTLSVYDAEPDGYTLLADSGSWSSFQLADESQKLPYDVLDRSFICKISVGETFLCCSSKMPWQSLDDVAKAIRKDPEDFIYGGLGGLSVSDLIPKQFLVETGADLSKMNKLSYTGGGQIMAALAGGNIQFSSGGYATVLPFVQSGTIRPLAVISDTRNPNFPDVPTTVEAGYPSVVLRSWTGISGPPKLPQEIVEKIDAAVAKIVERKEFIDEMNSLYAQIKYTNHKDAKATVIDEAEIVKKLLSQ